MRKTKKAKKFMAALMTTALVVTSFSSSELKILASQTEQTIANNTDREIDTKNYDYLALNEEMKGIAQASPEEADELEEIFMEGAQVEADSEEIEEELPSSVDCSQSEYFPAIGNQGSNGSCGYYSIFYTNLTFVYNRTK